MAQTEASAAAAATELKGKSVFEYMPQELLRKRNSTAVSRTRAGRGAVSGHAGQTPEFFRGHVLKAVEGTAAGDSLRSLYERQQGGACVAAPQQRDMIT